MIRAIPENYFLDKVKGKKHIIQEVSPDFLKDVSMKFKFFEIPERDIQFVHIPDLRKIISFSDRIYEEIDDEVSYSDWEIRKISDQLDKRYILNYLTKFHFIDPVKSYEDGQWILENKRIGVNYEFSLKTVSTYFTETYIGIPEKLTFKWDIRKIRTKTRFIEGILHGLSGDLDNED
jgi:hypothetical protein